MTDIDVMLEATAPAVLGKAEADRLRLEVSALTSLLNASRAGTRLAEHRTETAEALLREWRPVMKAVSRGAVGEDRRIDEAWEGMSETASEAASE